MVRRSLRSASWRLIKVKAPGGAIKIHYRKVRPKKAHCPVTGQPLQGVARLRQSQKANKTSKRPERPYGGVLSSKAMRSKFKQKARQIDAS
ncbi:MAG: 50S ribosomal protein L34e [Nanoarchaeota archaeon]|nr:50S ribosomal protein L34e [Nanoarchaeota archaeon]